MAAKSLKHLATSREVSESRQDEVNLANTSSCTRPGDYLSSIRYEYQKKKNNIRGSVMRQVCETDKLNAMY